MNVRTQADEYACNVEALMQYPGQYGQLADVKKRRRLDIMPDM